MSRNDRVDVLKWIESQADGLAWRVLSKSTTVASGTDVHSEIETVWQVLSGLGEGLYMFQISPTNTLAGARWVSRSFLVGGAPSKEAPPPGRQQELVQSQIATMGATWHMFDQALGLHTEAARKLNEIRSQGTYFERLLPPEELRDDFKGFLGLARSLAGLGIEYARKKVLP